jgi:hypothetical protein
MSHAIKDINGLTNSLISLYATVDRWCDIVDDMRDSRLRHTLHEFLLENRFTLISLVDSRDVEIKDKITYASRLHELEIRDLRSELRELLFEYLCYLEEIESAGGSPFDKAFARIQMLIASNQKKMSSVQEV